MIWTALILGLAGSLHCILMCSPLALAVTSGKGVFIKVLYNAGRISTYALTGALMAAFGNAISLSGFQMSLTILIGLMLLIMGVSGVTGLRIPFMTSVLSKISLFVKKTFSDFLKRKTLSSVFTLGMVNGLLPCGITYLALTYCLTLASPVDGFNFMVWFGLGTLPAMLGLTSIVGIAIKKYNLSGTRITRYSYVILGLVVITRLFFVQHQEIDRAVSHGIILLCQ
jgi:uncharacterized protein